MAKIKLVSWNVNGIRSVSKKGFFEWLDKEKPDVLGLQETKISKEHLTPELLAPKGYRSYFSHAEKKGYSGVALYVREEPVSVTEGLGIAHFDSEGRVLQADYGDFVLMNIYYPNGKASPERLAYKMSFYEAFLDYANKLRKKKKKLIVCGDYNTAHKEIDLARPKANQKISGFLPEERAWMDKFVEAGYSDTFRLFNDKPENYTWWDVISGARARNVGWRIDYFFTSNDLEKSLAGATIESQVMGSDHCPVTLTLKI
jgi:exodeoxyribonuclease-3